MGDELLGGRYRLDEVLGRGGMATVWRARDNRLDRPVAVKVLDHGDLRDPSAAARFDREARTVARLAHPNIVSVYDVGTHDGTGYIVMELVDGVTLAPMLAEGPLPIDRAASIGRQTADALGAAHAIGIVHRDVKPANIMVTPGGDVKVCDFGIARELHAAEATLTAPGAAIGTAAYMAPEQAAGAPVDARTDLYALGCVLYAMLTSAPPFTGDRPIDVLYQQLHNVPEPVRSRRPEVPPALDALVTGLLAKDPADRPADAGTVRDALDRPYGSTRAFTAVAGAAGLDGAGKAEAWPAGGPPRPTGEIGAGGLAGPGATRPMARATAPVPVPVPVRPGGVDEPVGYYPAGPPRRDRGFLGPVLVAVVVVALLIAAAFVLTALLDHQRQHPQTVPPAATHAPTAPTTPAPATTASEPPSPSPSTPPASTSAAGDPVDPVRTVLQQLVLAGQIDPGAADDLNHQLDEVDRALGKGRGDEASHKVGDIRDSLGGLAKDGKLSQAGYLTLVAALDTLAAAIPSQGGGG